MSEFRFPEFQAHDAAVGERHVVMGPFATRMIATDAVGAGLLSYSSGRDADACREWVRERHGEESVGAVDSLVSLAEAGCLTPVSPGAPPDDVPIDIVHLSLTHRCQMACKYCLAAGIRERPLEDMSVETIRAAVRYFADRAKAHGQPVLHFQCGSSGESMMREDLLLEVAALCRTEAERVGLILGSGATSNGVAIDAETARRLAEAGVGGSVSWDGPPEIHNAQRVRPDGAGSYDDAARAFAAIRDARNMPPAVGATLTGEHPDVTRIFSHLFDMGVRCLNMKPVRHISPELGVSEKTLPAYMAAYDEFVEYLLIPGPYRFERLCTLVESDFFWRFVFRLALPRPAGWRCPGARTSVCVDTNGDIYPCQDFQGMTDYKIGDVFNGIDEDARRVYMEMTCDRMTPCSTCWARTFCGGGCHSHGVNTMGAPDAPNPYDCRLKKHLTERAGYFIARLQEQRPGLIYHVLDFRTPVPPSETRPTASCYRTEPLGIRSETLDAWRSPQPIVLNDASQVRGYQTWGESARWDGPEDLSALIYLRWDDVNLYLMAEVTDPVFTPPPSADSEWWFYDSLRIGIDPQNDGGFCPDPGRLTRGDVELGVAMIGGKTVRFDLRGKPYAESPAWQARVERRGRLTVYRMVIPWTEIPPAGPGNEFRFAVVVNNCVRGQHRWLEWTPGLGCARDPEGFGGVVDCSLDRPQTP